MVIVSVLKDGVEIDSFDVSGRTVEEALLAVKNIVEEELPVEIPLSSISYSYSEV